MKRMLELRKEEFGLIGFLVLLIPVLVGVVIEVLMVVDDEEDIFVGMCSLMGFMILAIVYVIFCITNCSQLYNRLIGMGLTRKEFIREYFVTSGLILLMGVGILYVVSGIEHLIMSHLIIDEMSYEAVGWEFLLSPGILLYIVLVFGSAMFLAAIYHKFGPMVGWFSWAFAASCMFLSNHIEAHEENPSALMKLFIDFYEFGGIWGYAVVAILLALLMMFGATRILKKEMVRG